MDFPLPCLSTTWYILDSWQWESCLSQAVGISASWILTPWKLAFSVSKNRGRTGKRRDTPKLPDLNGKWLSTESTAWDGKGCPSSRPTHIPEMRICWIWLSIGCLGAPSSKGSLHFAAPFKLLAYSGYACVKITKHPKWMIWCWKLPSSRGSGLAHTRMFGLRSGCKLEFLQFLENYYELFEGLHSTFDSFISWCMLNSVVGFRIHSIHCTWILAGSVGCILRCFISAYVSSLHSHALACHPQIQILFNSKTTAVKCINSTFDSRSSSLKLAALWNRGPSTAWWPHWSFCHIWRSCS